MVGLFENLEEIKPRKEKVSPVGPFLSVAAQKHWQNFRVKIRNGVVMIKYFTRVGITIRHLLFACCRQNSLFDLRVFAKQAVDGEGRKGKFRRSF
jgi:hypothetical protein